MDLRVKKTKKNIEKAFIELINKKPMKKITVKEISELAEINKATFYLHFQDIYDLLDELEHKFIENTIYNMDYADTFLSSPEIFLEKLYESFNKHPEIPLIVGNNNYPLSKKIQEALSNKLFDSIPELSRTKEKEIVLQFILTGIFTSISDIPDHQHRQILAKIIATITSTDCFSGNAE